jgi:20S proteasome alpha/beta subunit
MTELTSCITFNSPPTEEVLRLDKEGFYYRDQFIADAGEAHRLMVEFLKQNTKPEPTDDELLELMPETMRDEFAAVSSVYSTATGGQVEPGLFRVVLNTVALEYARAVLARWENQ